jgi:hypothetical protein
MARKRIQWHPLFTGLLRPYVQPYYEVRTNVPVGDLPRAADLVLLRRTGTAAPFTGLWRFLTAWNLLEFKGPTEAARPGHLPLLAELGLGIARRLGQEGRSHGRRRPPSDQVAFWYLANRLGPRFRQEAERLLKDLEEMAAGVWRGWDMGHPVFLVSTVDLAVDEDSLPLHVLAAEPPQREREVAGFVASQPGRLDAYGGLFAVFHPDIWREVEIMAQRQRRTITIDLRPAIKTLGLPEVIRQIGEEEVIRQIGARRILGQLGVEEILANLPPRQRKELKRRLTEEEPG